MYIIYFKFDERNETAGISKIIFYRIELFKICIKKGYIINFCTKIFLSFDILSLYFYYFSYVSKSLKLLLLYIPYIYSKYRISEMKVISVFQH